MTDLDLAPKDYSATRRQQIDFYGAKALNHNNSRFKIKDMISPSADWSNPCHAPQQTSKNALDTIQERRGRKQRVNDSQIMLTDKVNPAPKERIPDSGPIS